MDGLDYSTLSVTGGTIERLSDNKRFLLTEFVLDGSNFKLLKSTLRKQSPIPGEQCLRVDRMVLANPTAEGLQAQLSSPERCKITLEGLVSDSKGLTLFVQIVLGNIAFGFARSSLPQNSNQLTSFPNVTIEMYPFGKYDIRPVVE